MEDKDLLQIDTGGGMIVTTYDIQREGNFDESCCIMKYPNRYNLFMDKRSMIYHP